MTSQEMVEKNRYLKKILAQAEESKDPDEQIRIMQELLDMQRKLRQGEESICPPENTREFELKIAKLAMECEELAMLLGAMPNLFGDDAQDAIDKLLVVSTMFHEKVESWDAHPRT